MGETDQLTEQLCAELEQLLEQCDDLDARVKGAVALLSRGMGVVENEVALFLLDERKTVLHFLWPERLKQVGFIPFSSLDSLAARTAREGRVFLSNTFASQHHASFFEKIRLEEGAGNRPLPIQKIISVPMLVEQEVKGVIQISRKGAENEPPLNDFNDADAERLLQLACRLGAAL